MIIETKYVYGFSEAIQGMRNPFNSWDSSDSGYVSTDCTHPSNFVIGEHDYKLMETLAKSGPSHSKYRRMIIVYVDITAPLYWWKEFDTYKVGTVANSCSTMHTIQSKEFTLADFSCHQLNESSKKILNEVIDILNYNREMFIERKDKTYWWQMIQLLPSSYNQKRTVMLNYEVLASIYETRKGHKLVEWEFFRTWIRGLPYSGLITLSNEQHNLY